MLLKVVMVDGILENLAVERANFGMPAAVMKTTTTQMRHLSPASPST